MLRILGNVISYDGQRVVLHRPGNKGRKVHLKFGALAVRDGPPVNVDTYTSELSQSRFHILHLTYAT